MSSLKLAKALSRAQKRLQSWLLRFEDSRLSSEVRNDLEELLSTYRLLLAKLAKASSEAEISEESQRLRELEAKLNQLFANYRLATSQISPIHKQLI